MQFCTRCGTYLSFSMLRRESAPVFVCAKCGMKNEIKETICLRGVLKDSGPVIECFSKDAKKLYERYRKSLSARGKRV